MLTLYAAAISDATGRMLHLAPAHACDIINCGIKKSEPTEPIRIEYGYLESSVDAAFFAGQAILFAGTYGGQQITLYSPHDPHSSDSYTLRGLSTGVPVVVAIAHFSDDHGCYIINTAGGIWDVYPTLAAARADLAAHAAMIERFAQGHSSRCART